MSNKSEELLKIMINIPGIELIAPKWMERISQRLAFQVALTRAHITSARHYYLPKPLAWPGQAHFFDPHHPFGQSMTDKTVWPLLEQNPYLEYKVESDQVYVISDGADLSLIVPKDRHVPEAYPPEESQPLMPAFQLLGWALLGLSLAGLGTLIFAPLAILRALRVYLSQPLSQADRTRVAVVLVIGSGLLGIALMLNFLFLLHFLP